MESVDGGDDAEDDVEDDDDERRIPTTCRTDRIMPLTMEIDRAVFTKSTHRTPSDGAGRLERPILIKTEVPRGSDL